MFVFGDKEHLYRILCVLYLEEATPYLRRELLASGEIGLLLGLNIARVSGTEFVIFEKIHSAWESDDLCTVKLFH